MRNPPIFIVTIALALSLADAAGAQDRGALAGASAPAAQVMQRMDLVARAFELRPRRRDTPLRYLNISDNEMREIQQVAANHLSKTVLNVSPVVEGCPCEEGPMCTEQVYVVTYASDKAIGLQLSRTKKVWKVGVVQLWWSKYDALRAQQEKMGYRAFVSAESELFRDFPICVGELVKVEGKK